MNHYEGSKLVSLLLSERSKGLSQAYGEGVGSLIEVSKWVALASLSLSVSQNPSPFLIFSGTTLPFLPSIQRQ